MACDLYLLGSLLVFLYSGVSLTHLILSRIDRSHRHENWSGTYREVLPYLRQAQSEVYRELRQYIPVGFSDEITEIVKQLCELDPSRRGHPKNAIYRGNQFSLERYITRFDLLAKKAERASLTLH